METVDVLISRPETVEYILLEVSGVADPAGIVTTFTSFKFRDRIRIVETNYYDVPYEVLMSVGRYDPAQIFLDQVDHNHGNGSSLGKDQDHGQDFHTWSYETDQPMSLEALQEMAKKLPGSIYRCKGVVFSNEAPQQRAVLQVVGRRSDVSLYYERGDNATHTQIVAIGAPQGIAGEELIKKIRCLHCRR